MFDFYMTDDGYRALFIKKGRFPRGKYYSDLQVRIHRSRRSRLICHCELKPL